MNMEIYRPWENSAFSLGLCVCSLLMVLLAVVRMFDFAVFVVEMTIDDVRGRDPVCESAEVDVLPLWGTFEIVGGDDHPLESVVSCLRFLTRGLRIHVVFDHEVFFQLVLFIQKGVKVCDFRHFWFRNVVWIVGTFILLFLDLLLEWSCRHKPPNKMFTQINFIFCWDYSSCHRITFQIIWSELLDLVVRRGRWFGSTSINTFHLTKILSWNRIVWYLGVRSLFELVLIVVQVDIIKLILIWELIFEIIRWIIWIYYCVL